MKKNKILKNIVPLTIVVIVFALIGKKAGWFGKAATVKVSVENAEKRTIIETITANGKIQPERKSRSLPTFQVKLLSLPSVKVTMLKKVSCCSGSNLTSISHSATALLLQSVRLVQDFHRPRHSSYRLIFHIKGTNSFMTKRLYPGRNLNRQKHPIWLPKLRLTRPDSP